MAERMQGGPVRAVVEESPAWRAGIQAGDLIVAVDDYAPRDILDWQWLTDDEIGRAHV